MNFIYLMVYMMKMKINVGIWLLINNKILINKGMLFKTGKTLILCELKENL